MPCKLALVVLAVISPHSALGSSPPHRFPRSHFKTCPQLAAVGCNSEGTPDHSLWPEFCCCTPQQACFDEETGHCVFCPGSFKLWQAANAGRGNALVVAALLAPRATLIALAVEGIYGGRGLERLDFAAENTSEPLPPRWIGDRLPIVAKGTHESLTSLVDASVPDVAADFIFPQARASLRMLPYARDSYWWVLAFVHAFLSSLLGEVSLLFLMVLHPRRACKQVGSNLRALTLGASASALTFVVHFLPFVGPKITSSIVVLLMTWHAARAACLPWLLRRSRRPLAACLAAGLPLLLLCFSERASMDATSLLLVALPVAAAAARFAVRLGFASRREVSVDQDNFFASSADALARLPPADMAFGPPQVVTLGAHASAEVSPPVQGSVVWDDMLLPQSAWLVRFLSELLEPANGLVEVTDVEGKRYARLRQGGDLLRLEALGRALGLAHRAGYFPELATSAATPATLLSPPLARLLSRADLPQLMTALLAEDEDALRTVDFSSAWAKWLGDDSGDEHARSTALQAFLLDVAAETQAVWRGLRAVPAVPLASFPERACGRKRPRGATGEEASADLPPEEERPPAAKRPRRHAPEEERPEL